MILLGWLACCTSRVILTLGGFAKDVDHQKGQAVELKGSHLRKPPPRIHIASHRRNWRYTPETLDYSYKIKPVV